MTDIQACGHPASAIESADEGTQHCAACEEEARNAPLCDGGGKDGVMQERPRRIRLSRAKGWKMPPNTVKVDRSTRWGNPFLVTSRRPRTRAVELYQIMLLLGFGVVGEEPTLTVQREYLMFARAYLHDLRGKNLACWCPPGAPCHADVLLKIADGDEGNELPGAAEMTE